MTRLSLFEDLPPRRSCDQDGHDEAATETDWGAPHGVRMTWTCRACGEIRGRC